MKILKEKDIRKKGNELFLKLVESVAVAYSKYMEAIEAWRRQDYDPAYHLRDKIILNADRNSFNFHR